MNKYFAINAVPTKDGTFTIPHPEHGQHYHTLQGAKFESLALYLEQSGLLEYLNKSTPVAVLDIGLGLGYNALTTIEGWWNHAGPSPLFMTSLEVDLELFLALISGSAPWQQNWPGLWFEWVKNVQGTERLYKLLLKHPLNCAVCKWEINIEDGLNWLGKYTATKIDQPFQFVWQDPFTPELNPRLWSEHFFSRLKMVCAQDVILLSYSVARIVKDALTASGWSFKVLRGKKIHKDWLKAWLIN